MIIIGYVRRFGRLFFRCAIHGVHVFRTPAQLARECGH